jgi:hypothetical protein
VREIRFFGASLLAAAALIIALPVHARIVSVDVQMTRNVPTRPVTPAGPAVSLRRTIPLPAIVGGLQSQLPYRNMNYIGVERFDPQSGIYALRFLNGRQVIVVVVDGRTGRILDRGF